MEAAGSTPTKSFCRLSLTPNSKNSVCLQCGNRIEIADRRRKLFDGGEKTQFCKNLDRIFALSSPHAGDISYFSNIICRPCSDRNITLLKKVDNAGRVLTETLIVSVLSLSTSCLPFCNTVTFVDKNSFDRVL